MLKNSQMGQFHAKGGDLELDLEKDQLWAQKFNIGLKYFIKNCTVGLIFSLQESEPNQTGLV